MRRGIWGTGSRRTAGRCHKMTWMGRRRLVGVMQRAGEYIVGRTLFDGPRGNSSRTSQIDRTASEA